MKSKLLLMSIIMLSLSFSAFAQSEKGNAQNESKFKTVVYKSSLHCQSCVDKVQRELPYMVKGLKEVTCNLDANTISVLYNSEKTTPEAIKKSILDLGYKADDPNAKAPGCSKSCPGKCGASQQHHNCSGEHKH